VAALFWSARTEEIRHGTIDGPPDVRLLGGYFDFNSPDAALIVSPLPALVHVRGAERLSVLVRLVSEESSGHKAGRNLALTRLDLLRTKDMGIDEVAERVGYGSASTFSTAFSRYAGQPPRSFARAKSG
jgi:hypothetical protein